MGLQGVADQAHSADLALPASIYCGKNHYECPKENDDHRHVSLAKHNWK